MILENAYNNKTVVITGHTGFKGTWLAAWLNHLGANVVGIALDPPTEPSHFSALELNDEINDLRVDIRDRDTLESVIGDAEPDFVFHLAAQPLVRSSYDDPIETWNINTMTSGCTNPLNSPCIARPKITSSRVTAVALSTLPAANPANASRNA